MMVTWHCNQISHFRVYRSGLFRGQCIVSFWDFLAAVSQVGSSKIQGFSNPSLICQLSFRSLFSVQFGMTSQDIHMGPIGDNMLARNQWWWRIALITVWFHFTLNLGQKSLMVWVLLSTAPSHLSRVINGIFQWAVCSAQEDVFEP